MIRSVTVFVVAGLITGGAALPPTAQAVPDADTGRLSQIVSSGTGTDAETLVDEAAAFKPKPIAWGTCTEKASLRKAKAQCGYLTVPLDYAKPSGTKIKLRIARVKHKVSAANYKGVMLASTSAPGSSGLWLSTASLKGRVPAKVSKAFDWVGYDARGTGHSKPVVTCGGGGYAVGHDRPDYRMTTLAKEKAWLTKAKKFAKACDKANGALLDHMKTRDTVNDLESLRKALGKEKISFYGFSYGSYVGEVYSSLHPTRIRRMVLDSPIDPRRVGYQAVLDQDIAMNASIKVFFAWMAKYNSRYHLGTTAAQVEASYYAQLDALDAKAAAGVFGPAELTDVFSVVGYNENNYPYVAQAFADLVNTGASADLRDIYDYIFGASADRARFDAGYLGTNCTEAAWPAAWSTWRADNVATNAVAPFMTYANSSYFAPCYYWGPKTGTPVKVNGAKVPAVLLVGETLDGNTPFAGALAVRSLFPRSRLIEGVGGTMPNSSMIARPCVENAIASYLWKGTLPARKAGATSDKKCKPYPVPIPLTAAAQALPTSSRVRVSAGAQERTWATR